MADTMHIYTILSHIREIDEEDADAIATSEATEAEFVRHISDREVTFVAGEPDYDAVIENSETQPWLETETFEISASVFHQLVQHVTDANGYVTDAGLVLLFRLRACFPDFQERDRSTIEHFIAGVNGLQVRDVGLLLQLGTYYVDQYSLEHFLKLRDGDNRIGLPAYMKAVETHLSGVRPKYSSKITYDWLFTRGDYDDETIQTLHKFFQERGYTLEYSMNGSIRLHGLKYIPMLMDNGCTYDPNMILTTLATNEFIGGVKPSIEDRMALIREIRTMSWRFQHAQPNWCGFGPCDYFNKSVEYLDWLVELGFRPKLSNFYDVVGIYNDVDATIDERKLVLQWLDRQLSAQDPAIALKSDDRERHFNGYDYPDWVRSDSDDATSELMDYCREHIGFVRRSFEQRQARHDAEAARKATFEELNGMKEDDYRRLQDRLGRHNGQCRHYAAGETCPEWPKCKYYHGRVEDTYKVRECKKRDCDRVDCKDFHYMTREDRKICAELKEYLSFNKKKDANKLSLMEQMELMHRAEGFPYNSFYLQKDTSMYLGVQLCFQAYCYGNKFDQCKTHDKRFMVRAKDARNRKTSYYCSFEHMVKCEQTETPVYELQEPYEELPMSWDRKTPAAVAEYTEREMFGCSYDYGEDYYY